jgi:hypothetical protein
MISQLENLDKGAVQIRRHCRRGGRRVGNNGNDEVIMVLRITIECLYFYLVVVQLLKL